MVPSAPLTRAQPRALRGCAILVIAGMVVALALAAAGAAERVLHEWPYTLAAWAAASSAILRAALLPRERLPWGLLATGLTSYAIGTTLWSFDVQYRQGEPFPTASDPFFLALYPLACGAVVMLVRARALRFSCTLALDAAVAALGTAAATSWLLWEALIESAGMLAYPLLDVFTVACVVFVFAASGWRPGPGWTLLGLGFLAMAAADVLCFSQLAQADFVGNRLVNVAFVPGLILLTLAPWRASDAGPLRLEGVAAAGVPVALGTLALGMLVADHFQPLPTLALLLATATVVAAMGRTVLSLQEARSAAESRRQALTDELTGLPNRRAFLGRLAEGIEGAHASGGKLALLMIDLDRFKELNDTLGHAAGDDLLAGLGPRLSHVVGRTGRLARLGGDEFGVILPDAAGAEALAVADRLQRALEQPFDLRGLRVAVGASTGVALYPDHATTGDELLQRADVAMYQAKRAGGGVELYRPEHDGHSRDRFVLAAELRHAIEHDEIGLVYQPKAAVEGGAVEAVEALARWQHHAHGPISPEQFVPLAEQTGHGRALTRLVLARVARDCAHWSASGRRLRVAVNLCSDDLLDPGFPAEVAQLLARWRLPPELLQVEVTENALMADPRAAHAVLERLRELGVESALDDFGTGHSSLAHLRRLPVSELKLDRSFVAGMATDHVDACIVRSITELARRLGLRVVAEGVEDAGTWALLWELGCDELQGTLLSVPLPRPELERWLDERARPRLDPGHAQAAPVGGR